MYITLKQHYIEYYHLFNADKKSKKNICFPLITIQLLIDCRFEWNSLKGLQLDASTF